MRPSDVIPTDAQREFWDVVVECIRVFHPTRLVRAMKGLDRLQDRLETVPIEVYEFFFHSEPFDVACGLASHPLRVVEHRDRYLKIRDGVDVQSTNPT